MRASSGGLVPALRALSEYAETAFGVRCTIEYEGVSLVFDDDTATHLYRIAQEAVTNSVKHGKARNIHISLVQAHGNMTLRVKDDGVGLPKDALKNKGMGMRVMQHRARMIGATLEIEKAQPCGTMVSCKLEYVPPPDARTDAATGRGRKKGRTARKPHKPTAR